MTFPRFRFRSLQARLATLYIGLFAGIAIAIAVVAHLLIVTHARETVRAEMMASGGVYDRLWAMRVRSLEETAGLLAHDFGFRGAVATGDAPTILSALDNIGVRAGVPMAAVVSTDGVVTGRVGALRHTVAALPRTLTPGQTDLVVATEEGVYRLVVSPVMAPEEVGLVVFAVPVDRAELRGLEQLSALPMKATIIQRHDGHWIASDGTQIGSRALDRLADTPGPRRLAQLRIGAYDSYALVKRLGTQPGGMQAATLVSYPVDAAMAPYQPLQIALALVGIVGLGLVLVGSRHLAGTIARPVAALGKAAQALEDGTRTEVAVTQEDEIGQLSAAFNRMSAGIIERENRIGHMAFHDALTGLPNRALFHQQLGQALARARRTDEPVAVLCLDLDGFKVINDTLGHPAGDGLLLSVARLLERLAGEALIARLGGDEFAIILAGGFAPDRPRALAQAISDAFTRPIAAGDHLVASSTSIGIVIGSGESDPEALLKNADLALYRAKEDGRACFRFYDTSLDTAARIRHQLELDLREAVQSGEFMLHYQPIVGLKQDRIIGFEALLRWPHPERGMISPADFIPVAEETGLIVPIGEWVLREACLQAAAWPDDVRIAVNVSPIQFRSPGFMPTVLQALARSGLAPNRLEIEITESVFLGGQQNVVAILHQLRGMGIRVALDDFGTGYSSLSYLRSFPFDKLKIDRSFVTDVANDAGAAAIVHAIVELANALHMETTAEGVELVQQLHELRGQGCSSIQGYLFSRPVPLAATYDLLRTCRAEAEAEAA